LSLLLLFTRLALSFFSIFSFTLSCSSNSVCFFEWFLINL
jgi:hypothetical protein